MSILYWLKLNHKPKSLAPLILRDNYQSTWLVTVRHKLAQYGFSEHLLTNLHYDQAESLTKLRFKDISRQRDLASSPDFLCPDKIRYRLVPVPYLFNLEIINQRRAFSQVQCSVLPTAMLVGRYKKILFSQRQCPCLWFNLLIPCWTIYSVKWRGL